MGKKSAFRKIDSLPHLTQQHTRQGETRYTVFLVAFYLVAY